MHGGLDFVVFAVIMAAIYYRRSRKLFLRTLAVFYAFGAVIHVSNLIFIADYAQLEMDLDVDLERYGHLWKLADYIYGVLDIVAAVGLWLQRQFGSILLFVLAASQLLCYGVFFSIFSWQPFMIFFHIVTLAMFFAIPESIEPQT